jgi:LmbE family N-acetylglucosaminyl deacetylase
MILAWPVRPSLPLCVSLCVVTFALTPRSRAADAPSYSVAATTADAAALLAADESDWAGASGIAWGPVPYETRFRAAWSGEGLFLRWDVTDPSPWHTMTRRDEHLWDEEVVEIFLSPDGSGRDYYELEINPANVVCDLRMVSAWPNQKGDIAWDLAGLETRVHPRKDTAGRTTGWTATALLPWSGLRALPSAGTVAVPPRPGDRWRFNVFRIERPGGPAAPEKDGVFAAWSPPSVKTFHDSGAFRDLVFEGPRPGSAGGAVDPGGKVLLAVFAHPDDEASVAPVLAKYAGLGAAVHLAVATDGRLGVAEHAGIPADDALAGVRAGEMRCAAAKLGAREPILMGLADQLRMQEGLAAVHEQLARLRESVQKLFEDLQPDVVLTWNASGWTGHHDHRLVSAVVTEVFQSRRWIRPSQLYCAAIPNGARPAVGPMALATVDESYLTVTVPLSDADWARARDAWSCHASQYTPAAIDALHGSLQLAWKDGARFQPLVPAPPTTRATLF